MFLLNFPFNKSENNKRIEENWGKKCSLMRDFFIALGSYKEK